MHENCKKNPGSLLEKPIEGCLLCLISVEYSAVNVNQTIRSDCFLRKDGGLNFQIYPSASLWVQSEIEGNRTW